MKKISVKEFPLETDVLIIGSGLAGAYAALEIIKSSAAHITVVTQSRLVQSNSRWAQGGIAAALEEGDDPSFHAADTLVAGAGLCHPEAVNVLTREGRECVRELAAFGVPFTPDVGLEGGHSRRRILHTPGSQTGKEIMTVLAQHLRQVPGDRLSVVENAELIELITAGERCWGGWFRYSEDGRTQIVRITARTTLLATGGACGLYLFTTNPPEAVGSGIGAAYQAGAAVADVEFVQFHPTALRRADGHCTLISEAVRGEGAHLLNANGERFMPAVHPLAELAPRDIVARAVFSEMERLAEPVYLSLRHLSAKEMHLAFPFLSDICREEGLDLARDLIPIAPAAHYLCGGVWSDLNGRSTLPGLWVAGEVACTGVHGANRLASNSLLECLVFGARAAHDLLTQLDSLSPPANLGEPPAPPSVADLNPLREAISHHLGLVRDRPGLEEFLGWLQTQPQTLPYVCASLMTRGALLRTESRGCHYRSDAPELADQAYRIVQRRDLPPVHVPPTANPEAVLHPA